MGAGNNLIDAGMRLCVTACDSFIFWAIISGNEEIISLQNDVINTNYLIPYLLTLIHAIINLITRWIEA